MKKNSLTTAVAAGIAGVAGLAGVANAVNINPDGLGQVLLYPYYTVNAGQATLMSVVNTTNRAKAVKVRFLESLNSAEVLDFNLYLSPFDVWTASLVSTAGGASLFTTDTSCTVPNGIGSGTAGTAFVNFEFAGNNPDIIADGEVRLGGPGGTLVDITDAERMRQGHAEIIEMGELFDTGTFIPASWTTHTATTLRPLNCAALQSAWQPGTPTGAAAAQWAGPGGEDFRGRGVNAPTGGLFGGAVIVDVAFGRALSYNADAIDNFWSPVGLVDAVAAPAGGTADNHRAPGTIKPDLRDARTRADDSADANIFINGTVVTANFANGIDAVSAVLMSRYIFNEFNLETGLAAASDWVVTFPTKRNYAYRASPQTAAAVRPFTDINEVGVLGGANGNGTTTGEPTAYRDGITFDTFGSCEFFSFSRWDREELPSAPAVTPVIPSPPPPQAGPTPNPRMCWEANVIAFNQTLAADTPSAVLGATPKQGAIGLTGPFGAGIQNGWARVEFDNSQAAGFQNFLVSSDAAPSVFIGLPVVGFWAADYTNNNVGGNIRANFSEIHKHRQARGFVTFASPAAVDAAIGTNGGLTTTGATGGFGQS